MSVTPLNWRAAGALAEQLLAGWQRRGEPGGAITLFDAEQLRATACAGRRSGAEYPFTVDSVVRYASVTKHIFAALALNATGGAIRLDQRRANCCPPCSLRWRTSPSAGAGHDRRPARRARDARLARHLAARRQRGAAGHAVCRRAGEVELRSRQRDRLQQYRLSAAGAALRSKGYDFDQLVQQHIAQPLQVQMQAPESWFDVVPGWCRVTGGRRRAGNTPAPACTFPPPVA